MKLFKNTCLSCHGNQGTGGHNGPDLQISKVTSDKNAVIDRIKNGGSSMPAFEGMLTEEEINSSRRICHNRDFSFRKIINSHCSDIATVAFCLEFLVLWVSLIR